MPETPETPESPAPARRTVLRGAAAAAAASVPLIAAPAAEATSRAPKKPKGKPIGAAKDVPVGGGKYFEKASVVVTQPTKGKFLGFNAICTHANCPVTNFETKDKMICECHNGEFSLEGKPLKPPVRKPMNPAKIVVEGGKIYKG
ncbi:MAG: Rieske (2Fe-2S) protein [Sporichthyaceae bacterium]